MTTSRPRNACAAALALVTLVGPLALSSTGSAALADDGGASGSTSHRAADTDTVTVPLPGRTTVEDVALDESAGRLYLARGSDVQVVSLTGERLDLIELSGGRIRDLTVSSDGTLLYVGTRSDLVVVDVRPGGPTSSFPLGGYSCPDGIAETRGVVVVAVDSCVGDAELALVDPEDGLLTRVTEVPSSIAAVAAPPSRPGTVFVAGRSEVARVDIGEGPGYVADVADVATARAGSGSGLALTPDDEQLLAADGVLRSTADLTSGRRVIDEEGPFAVSTGSATAASLVGGRLVSVDLDAGEEIGREPIAQKYLRGGGRLITFGEERMYAVTGGDDGWWLTSALARRSVNLRLRVPSREYDYREIVRVRVAGLPARVPAHASFDPFGPVPSREVWSGTAGRDGVVTLSPRATRSGRLTVSVAGDDTYQADIERVVYRVGARITGRALDPLRHDGRYAVYRRGDRAVVLSTVAPDHTGDCVKLEAEFLVSGRWRGRPGECVRLGDGSRLSAYLDGRAQYVGIPIRVRTLMNVADNLPSRSAWTYLRFVGAAGRVDPSRQPDDLLLEVL